MTSPRPRVGDQIETVPASNVPMGRLSAAITEALAAAGLLAPTPATPEQVRAEAWDAGWHAGYTDRHRERVGSDGNLIRREPTPNPYRAGVPVEGSQG